MTDTQRAQLWATSPVFDEETRREARAALANREECALRFGSELQFGTGGLRGILGVGTNRMNPYTVARATTGLARYLQRAGGRAVAIAYDSRHGSRAFALVAAGVLARYGLTAFLFPALMPTPVLSFAVRERGAAAGVMITASHNPAEYNGYKVYGPDGCQITDAAAAAITSEIDAVRYDQLAWLCPEEARAADRLRDMPESVYADYLQRTLACRLTPLAHAPLRVCYTPLNGAGLVQVLDAFRLMPGVTVSTVPEQTSPDGDFPTCPQPNPELPAALSLAIQTAKRTDSDLVIATDPDSDRIGVAAKAANGRYEILTGNEIGLLLLQAVLQARAQNGTLPSHAEVVKTIVTSDLAFPIAAEYGVTVRQTLTGFKYIGEEIGRLEALGHEERFLFGFEESCGYLAGTHVRDKDGVMAAVLVCEMAQRAAARGLSLTALRDALYARFGFVGTRLLSYTGSGADPAAGMRLQMERLRAHPPRMLAGEPVGAVLDYLPGRDGLPPSDVLVFRCARGKAIVRPSGTEPKVKVYLSAPGANATEAAATLDAMQADTVRWFPDAMP
ncbi:MAG: phospho-sugar mutase [Clostridiales bacterium]|nr:phospho-sugar mutase [Clostridiales bacterium]